MKPDFLIIGAQKSATSWMHFHLRQHPGIFLPEDKDYEFFSYVGNLNEDTFNQWCTRFTSAQSGARIGDTNAAYFWTATGSPYSDKPGDFNPKIPAGVRQFLGPDLQLITSIRNPVERAVSAYVHHIVHGAISPEESIDSTTAPLGIVDRGFYAAHLENWLKYYPAGQLLLINGLPGGQNSARYCLDELTAFLDVGGFPESHAADTPVLPGVPRRFEEDGVWVAAEHPLIARHLPLQRTVPIESKDGGNYVRLVDRAELDNLQALFRHDQQQLAGLLATNTIRTLDPDSSLQFNPDVPS